MRIAKHNVRDSLILETKVLMFTHYLGLKLKFNFLRASEDV